MFTACAAAGIAVSQKEYVHAVSALLGFVACLLVGLTSDLSRAQNASCCERHESMRPVPLRSASLHGAYKLGWCCGFLKGLLDRCFPQAQLLL